MPIRQREQYKNMHGNNFGSNCVCLTSMLQHLDGVSRRRAVRNGRNSRVDLMDRVALPWSRIGMALSASKDFPHLALCIHGLSRPIEETERVVDQYDSMRESSFYDSPSREKRRLKQ
jgi:hypothetical protein